MLGHVAREAGPEANAVGIDIHARLDEGHRRILQVKLGTRGKRVVDAVHTKHLEQRSILSVTG